MPGVYVERDEHLATLVLNRPEKLNALDAATLDDFSEAFSTLEQDENVHCIIIQGQGRAFSVGYDVTEESHEEDRLTYDDWRHLRANIERWLKVWKCPKPVIASVHGYCLGGATQLAVCADITVVSRDATIGWPSLPLGGGLLSPVSCWLIGPKKAKELSFIAGSSFTGEEAVALGWANYAVEEVDLQQKSRELAGKIMKTPMDLLRIKKTALNRIMDIQGFSETILFGAELDAVAHHSNGYLEMKALITRLGLKEALKEFQDG